MPELGRCFCSEDTPPSRGPDGERFPVVVGSEQVEEGSGQRAGDLQPNPATC